MLGVKDGRREALLEVPPIVDQVRTSAGHNHNFISD